MRQHLPHGFLPTIVACFALGIIHLRCEAAAVRVAQAHAVRLRALIERTPKQHRHIQVFRKAGTFVFRAEVAVWQEKSVDLLFFEFLCLVGAKPILMWLIVFLLKSMSHAVQPRFFCFYSSISHLESMIQPANSPYILYDSCFRRFQRKNGTKTSDGDIAKPNKRTFAAYFV